MERLVSAHQLERRLSNIEDQVSKSASVQLVNSSDEVYRVATKIAGAADSQLRTVIVSPGPKAPAYFVEAIGRRLKERLDAGRPVSF